MAVIRRQSAVSAYPGWDPTVPLRLGRADENPVPAVEEYLRKVGLSELRRRRARWWLRLMPLLLLTVSAWFVVYHLQDYNGAAWQEAGMVAMVLLTTVTFTVAATNACALLPSDNPTAWIVKIVLMLVFGLMLGAVAVLVTWGGLRGWGDWGQPVDPTNLAMGLAVALSWTVAIVGGLSLARAVVAVAVRMRWRDLRSSLGTTPEMLFLVAFVIILGDVWKVLAGMHGWRIEVFLLGSVLLSTAVLVARLSEEIRVVWLIDTAVARRAALEHHRSAELLRRARPRPVARRVRLRGRARWNAVLLVVLPLTVRLIVAGLALTVLLFVLGLVIMDSGRVADAAPRVPLPIAALKVAAMLSGLSILVVAATQKEDVLRRLARQRIRHLMPALGVWAAYYGEPEVEVERGRVGNLYPDAKAASV